MLGAIEDPDAQDQQQNTGYPVMHEQQDKSCQRDSNTEKRLKHASSA